VQEAIRPALAGGTWVVCERYIDSTLAYQGYGLGLQVDELRRMNDFVTGALWPQLTVLLDVPVESGLARSQNRRGAPDRIESRAIDYHRRVRDGYLSLAAREPKRFCVVDGGLKPEDVHATIVARVEGLLKGGCGR
jgi:dTMP kinase